MAVDPQALGAKIAALRELRGLSLGGLAERAGGMAKSYLAKLERGEVDNPGLRTLAAIAHALGVTVADLLNAVGPARSPGGAALLDEEGELRHVMENLPEGLAEFLQECQREGQPVPLTTARALALVEFRGQRPRTVDDWRFLYNALRRSIRS